MNIKNPIDVNLYGVGALVCRFQVHNLHDGHIKLLDYVNKNHKKVIVFLGVARVQNTQTNPLDFATRKAMVQELYPNMVILPLADQRTDTRWSQDLDEQISIPFGPQSTLLYGSRDSFIPYYSGKHTVAEVVTDVFYSGTEIRKKVSKEILATSDFRAGVIHANYARYDITYPTVDIVVYNDDRQLLFAKKSNESNYRFIGGFVDRKDESYEAAAKREFMEETGGAEIGQLQYVASGKIRDWRYEGQRDGIMTTLFIAKFGFGRIEPSDDIASLHWVPIADFIKWYKSNTLYEFVMEEHFGLMEELAESLINGKFSQ